MMKSKEVKVGRFGITAFSNYYRSDAIMDYQGKSVVYRYDPKDLSVIHVYTAKGSFIGTGRKQHRSAWNDEGAYKKIKKLEKRRRNAIKEQRVAAEELAEVKFGYRKHDPPTEGSNKPAKVIRLLKTPFDGVQKQIDEENERAVAFGGNQSGLADRYKQTFSIENRETKRESAKRKSFLKLTINDPVSEE